LQQSRTLSARSETQVRVWKRNLPAYTRLGTNPLSASCTWPIRAWRSWTGARAHYLSGVKMSIDDSDIIVVMTKVTQEWRRERNTEERASRSRESRKYVYSDRVDFTEVADEILPEAYAHASGDGQYTVDKRQFYYAARDEFLPLTGRE